MVYFMFMLYLEDYLMYEHHPWGLWVSMTGRLAWSREAWKTSDLSRLPGIASGLVALNGLMPFSNFSTPFLLTTMDLTLGSWHLRCVLLGKY